MIAVVVQCDAMRCDVVLTSGGGVTIVVVVVG